MTRRLHPALWWIAAFIGWTALALLVVGGDVAATQLKGRGSDNWQEVLIWRLVDWYEIGLFVPIIGIVVRWRPLERHHLSERAPLHLLLTVGAVCIRHLVFPLVRARLGDPMAAAAPLMALAGNFVTDTIGFLVIDALFHGVEYYRRYLDRAMATVQLQARLSDARLHALRAQLNPHFLFNTLNAATTLLHRDPIAADHMLTGLGELLRHTLKQDGSHETPLREELSVLDRYVEIMKIRFGPRVTVHQQVDPDVLDLMVPSLVLQPLVENAFEHGIARLRGPGHVWIHATRDEVALVLIVEDDGPGPNRRVRNGTGMGLDITARRLNELYGSAARLTLAERERGGAVARVRLPARRVAEPEHSD